MPAASQGILAGHDAGAPRDEEALLRAAQARRAADDAPAERGLRTRRAVVLRCSSSSSSFVVE